MTAMTSPAAFAPGHVPVLLDEVLAALSPATGGAFLDGTLGDGGYSRALLDAGADRVVAVDRDPEALRRAEAWRVPYGARLDLVQGRFGALDRIAAEAGAGPDRLAGVALDIGVSSMQLDQAGRGEDRGSGLGVGNGRRHNSDDTGRDDEAAWMFPDEDVGD